MGWRKIFNLLPRTNIDDTYNKAQELRLLMDIKLPPVTISAGVIEVSDFDTITTCIKRADKALYSAK